MPPEDVKRCVNMIESKSDKYNLDDAEDREEFTHEIKSFLVDSDRVQSKKIERLERHLEEEENKNKYIRKEKNNLEKDVENLKEGLKEVNEKLDKKENRLEKIKKSVKMRKQLRNRIGLIIIIVVLTTVSMYFVSSSISNVSSNPLMQINKWSGILAVLITVEISIGLKFIHSDHIKALSENVSE